MLNIKEYRVSRPALYGPETQGYSDPWAREGHYILSTSEAEAAKKFAKRYNDLFFDIEDWNATTYPPTVERYSRTGEQMYVDNTYKRWGKPF